MGILDSIENMASGAQGAQGSEQGRVAGGFLEALQQHPGGLGSVMSSFRQNGMDQHVDQWQTGQQQQATPEQVQTGLGGTGLIEQTAAKAGISPEAAKVGLAVVLPMLLAHMTNNGQQAPPSNGGEFGSLAGSFLSRLL